ncbi:hypothetical protein B0A52_09633 [Exophiala mesophila]|uniref:MARVEL domain-containing protein n=1 Tax=Exophiala mesophila TaxID=212818 RepID=A0A438MT59_EXOME|nr:hypothetical protein B0A52_09633 [Exophiala mesophila]
MTTPAPPTNPHLATSKHSQITASRTAILRCIGIIFGIAALGAQIAVARIDFFEIWISPESFVFISVSLVWNTAELLVRYKKSHGIHPGAHVALDLILCLGTFCAGLLQILINHWDGRAVAAGCLKFPLSLVHLVLLVYACKDTHQLRQRRKVAVVNEEGIDLKTVGR